MPEIAVSVRDLAAFCHRAGDLDARFGPGPSAAEGVRGHRELAASRGADYLAEHPLEFTWCRGDLTLQLRGRADGYVPSVPMIEEIKTCRIDPARLPADLSRLHLAQARLYAAMLADAEQLSEVQVRLTWYQLDRREERPLDQTYSAVELAGFLETSLACYADWLQERLQHAALRNASIRALAFPFREYRQGQREVAELVYKCAHGGGQLMLEAPTGLGKTAAVLYPAIKGLAHDCHEHVVFCTAKHTGRDAAEETLARFSGEGLHITSLALTAKARICFSPGHACRADDCRFARAYYDKLPAARRAALALGALTQTALESIARAHELCPYQLGLDLLPWVDVAITDQHHVFSMHAAVSGLAMQSPSRWTVLVDEAHNLPARARSMYSATLAADFTAVRDVLRGPPRRALAALEAVRRELFQAHMPPGGDYAVLSAPPTSLIAHMQAVVAAIAEQLAQPAAPARPHPAVQSLYFELLHFIRLSELADEDFCWELLAAEGEVLRLNCIDPARLLGQRHAALHALVVFSATLSPAHWMRAMLGLTAAAVFRRCASPFAPEQLDVRIDASIDTRLPHRARSRPALLASLEGWLSARPGNCLVFFPSHRYLQDCIDALRPQLKGRKLWVQPPSGTTAGAGELRELLRTQRNVCALCLLGGMFSEGIDLPGEQLASVVLVGPGLPQPDRDNRLQQAYFQRRYGAGFRYASLYPAMQRANQSLGRVIRGESDHGAALLIDRRYALPEYRDLLAAHWTYKVITE